MDVQNGNETTMASLVTVFLLSLGVGLGVGLGASTPKDKQVGFWIVGVVVALLVAFVVVRRWDMFFGALRIVPNRYVEFDPDTKFWGTLSLGVVAVLGLAIGFIQLAPRSMQSDLYSWIGSMLFVLVAVYIFKRDWFAQVFVLEFVVAAVLCCVLYWNKFVNRSLLIFAFVVPAVLMVAAVLNVQRISKRTNLSETLLGVGAVVIYAALATLLLALNPNEFMGKYEESKTNVFVLAAVCLFALVGICWNKVSVKEPWEQYFGKMGFLLMSVLAASYAFQYAIQFYLQKPGEASETTRVLMGLIIAGFCVVAAVTVFPLLSKPSNNVQSKQAMMQYLGAWVYCQLIDLSSEIKTKVGVKILLVIEVLLIVFYFLSLRLYKKLEEGSIGNQVLNEPVKLNKVQSFDVRCVQGGDCEKTKKFEANYAISFWLYLYPQPKEHDPDASYYVNVLDYGGKPTVQYNAASNLLRITMKGPDAAQTFAADIPNVPLQRWHHIVLSYNNATFDMFLNGALYRSVPSVLTNVDQTQLIVGSHQGNRKNKMCNVVFFQGKPDPSKPFGKSEEAITVDKVLQLYNNFVNKDPPMITRAVSMYPDPTYLNMRWF
jgi:hypothetical protein